MKWMPYFPPRIHPSVVLYYDGSGLDYFMQKLLLNLPFYTHRYTIIQTHRYSTLQHRQTIIYIQNSTIQTHRRYCTITEVLDTLQYRLIDTVQYRSLRYSTVKCRLINTVQYRSHRYIYRLHDTVQYRLIDTVQYRLIDTLQYRHIDTVHYNTDS